MEQVVWRPASRPAVKGAVVKLERRGNCARRNMLRNALAVHFGRPTECSMTPVSFRVGESMDKETAVSCDGSTDLADAQSKRYVQRSGRPTSNTTTQTLPWDQVLYTMPWCGRFWCLADLETDDRSIALPAWRSTYCPQPTRTHSSHTHLAVLSSNHLPVHSRTILKIPADPHCRTATARAYLHHGPHSLPHHHSRPGPGPLHSRGQSRWLPLKTLH